MNTRNKIVHTLLLSAGIILSGVQSIAQSLSLSLPDAVSLAIKNNRSLKLSGLDIDKASEEIRVARSLSLPTANVGGQYLHYFVMPAFFGFGGSGGGDKIPYSRIGGRDQFAATLSVAYPIYNPSAKPVLREAQLNQQASKTAQKGNEVEVAAAVKRVYLGLLVIDQRLQLQYESLERNEKALQDARSLLAQGRGLRVDTLRAYTSVKNLQPDILKLKYALQVGKQQLVTLMGIDSLSQVQLTDSLVLAKDEPIPAEAEVYEDAKTQRPDLQVLAISQLISDEQIQQAQAQRKPTVSLIGQYQLQSQAKGANFFDAYWPSATFAGAQVVVPLFSGYKHQARISQAKITKDQSAVRLNDAQQQLKTEVVQVIANLQETFERMKTQVQVKETAKLSYDIIQYRYSKGVASRLELTDAELALTTAQLNYLEAVYEYLAARIELDRTRGRQ
ncbi:TolC family protein [Paraflavitalea sp. CAU 1676]|uniref:TolC family protein n=1 Tax=Paraflavitalea sp. CAU 1676 TaxID=3032598 RepID=UPI0023DB17E5|nr:TolC family protein [Paraflavitalea sp. CAU 1676]MDF2186936.1 TolC family protein [Paraflavitalea sp. CAU 1676]